MTIFGGQTITIVSRSQTSVDALGAAVMAETTTDIPGCRHRPLVPIESGGGGQARAEKITEVGIGVASSWWKSTVPISPSNSFAILALKPNDEINVNGIRYVIVSGLHVFDDFYGNPFKATIVSVLQEEGI